MPSQGQKVLYGILVGILSRDAIMRHLEVRRGLGLDADEGHVEKRLADVA